MGSGHLAEGSRKTEVGGEAKGPWEQVCRSVEGGETLGREPGVGVFTSPPQPLLLSSMPELCGGC